MSKMSSGPPTGRADGRPNGWPSSKATCTPAATAMAVRVRGRRPTQWLALARGKLYTSCDRHGRGVSAPPAAGAAGQPLKRPRPGGWLSPPGGRWPTPQTTAAEGVGPAGRGVRWPTPQTTTAEGIGAAGTAAIGQPLKRP
jgi:hypothetical protein